MGAISHQNYRPRYTIDPFCTTPLLSTILRCGRILWGALMINDCSQSAALEGQSALGIGYKMYLWKKFHPNGTFYGRISHTDGRT